MYSDMSMRIIARSSSNRNSASALVSSVLPTPVGPRNRNEPIGRFGSCSPARAPRTACERAALTLEHLLDRPPGPARHDRRDVLGGDRLLAHDAAPLLGFGLFGLLLEVRDDAIGELAGAGPVAPTLHLLELDAGLIELLFQLLRVGGLLFLGLPLRGQLGRLLLEVAELLLELLQALA